MIAFNAMPLLALGAALLFLLWIVIVAWCASEELPGWATAIALIPPVTIAIIIGFAT